MNSAQQKYYKTLKTQQEKARYLLSLGVTAKTQIENLDFVWSAMVGEATLPVKGESEEDAIAKGKKWLEEMANGK